MPLDPFLLEILRCPATHQRLALAPAEFLASLERQRATGGLKTLAGAAVEPFESGLVTEDGRMFYPVRAGIPMLLAEESIPVG